LLLLLLEGLNVIELASANGWVEQMNVRIQPGDGIIKFFRLSSLIASVAYAVRVINPGLSEGSIWT
jgi:hypothetical protein